MEHRSLADFAGQRVIVVGEGNSGAQIAADLAYDTGLTWVAQRPPRFLADNIDGCALVDAATARRRALAGGDSRRLLAGTPLLLVAQMLLLPGFLYLFVGPDLGRTRCRA